jgi:hypothetical protein
VIRIDQIRTGLGVLAFGEAVTQRPDTSADSVPRFQHRDLGAGLLQVGRCRKACKPGTRDDDGPTAQHAIICHNSPLNRKRDKTSHIQRSMIKKHAWLRKVLERTRCLLFCRDCVNHVLLEVGDALIGKW